MINNFNSEENKKEEKKIIKIDEIKKEQKQNIFGGLL